MNKTVFETRKHFMSCCLILATTTVLGLSGPKAVAETHAQSEYTEADGNVKHEADVVDIKLYDTATKSVIEEYKTEENVGPSGEASNTDGKEVKSDEETSAEVSTASEITSTDNEVYASDTVISDDWTENEDADISDIEESDDMNLLDKYSYALYDDSGVRNDIDEDILKLAENLCAQQGIDPNLFLAIVMTESQGHADAKNKHSTAIGFGQLLSSTGRWCYEDLLGYGKGTYSHSLAYNPVLNTEMTISLLGELKREHNGNMYKAIQHYRGKKNISGYLGKMNKWLGKEGLDVSYYI